MTEPRPDAAPPPAPTAVTGLPWHGVGTVLAAAAVGLVGYVAFSTVELVEMSTSDTPNVSPVADPPLLVTYSSAPETAAPEREPSARAETSRNAPRPAQASAAPSQAPGSAKSAGPAQQAGKASTIASAAERRQRAQNRRAHWADRQLAAMLRTMPAATAWFSGATWVVPVAEYHLTARFGESGSHWATTHTGLDLAAPTGTPVRAATAGTVTFAGWAGSYGNKIEITHPDGSETWYSHLSRMDVHAGTPVGTGNYIGAVGATGNVTGAHLHFEVRPGGDSPIDPFTALQQHGVRI